jgi:thermolabile hemolysin
MKYFARFLVALAAILSLLLPAWVGAAPYSNIYVFGDSLSDSGRIFAMVGFPGKPYYQGRFSNGPIWVENAAPILGLTFDPATNFAYGGAKSDASNTSRLLPGLSAEIDLYLAADKVADPRALYVVWAGSNDFFSGSTDIDKVVANIVAALGRLHTAGAQYFLVGGLPDLGLTPYARANGLTAALSATSAGYNRALRKALAGLDYPVAYVEVAALQQKIVTNPSAHGFQNVVDACLQGAQVCDHPDGYLYWDDKHPTAAVHKLLADQFLDATGIARFDAATSKLRVPAVAVGGSLFDADLQLAQLSGGTYRFSLVAGSGVAAEAGTRLSGQAGTFVAATGKLALPTIQVNGRSYSATFDYLAPDRFDLAPAGLAGR